jgi:hypothetical protein
MKHTASSVKMEEPTYSSRGRNRTKHGLIHDDHDDDDDDEKRSRGKAIFVTGRGGP